MDGVLMLQAEQWVRTPCSILYDLYLGGCSSLPCIHNLCIEGIPFDLIIGLVAGLVMGVFSAATCVSCGFCLTGCCPCLIPLWGCLAPSIGYYVWPCPPGMVWTCLCCSGTLLPLEYCCVGCCPGMTYDCMIGPILAGCEARIWPCINRAASCFSGFTCPCL
jgi:hypothetical protein